MSAYQSRVFGQYTLLDRIASGGMAEIFLARTKGFGGFEKTLVIKRLHPHYSDDQQFVKMLVDEAKISVQLQHANVVQIFDLGRIGGQYYIAMEYVAGKDLFHVLRELHQNDLQMPIEAAVFIAMQLCHGLQYAHCKRDDNSGKPLQIIHRDISPQNILLSWSGEVKVADFGIVKAAQRSTHTEAGVIKGKFYYMSPEQALGIDIDWRSDVFSAGIVLFESLTATPLYDETDDAELMQRVQSGVVRSPCEFRDDISPELERIVMKALTTDRDERYQSALQLGRDLADYLVSRGRSFTKVDLGDFLGSLFRESVNTDPTTGRAPASTSPMKSAVRSDDTVADAPLQVPADPTIADRPLMATPPPLPIDSDDAPTPSPGPDTARPLPRRRPEETVDLPPSALVPTDRDIEPPTESVIVATPPPAAKNPVRDVPSSPDARTTRLSVEEIQRVNEAMLARSRAERTQPDQPQPRREIAAPVLTPMPVRLERSRRQLRLRKRERALKIALAAVAMAILAVSASIVWLLVNPVTIPPMDDAPAQPPPPAIAPSTVSRADAPKWRVPRPAPRAGDDLPETDTTPAMLRIEALAAQRYKLYVDGELADVRDGSVAVTPGRHTIQARLLPEGTLTRKQVVELDPGATHRIEL